MAYPDRGRGPHGGGAPDLQDPGSRAQETLTPDERRPETPRGAAGTPQILRTLEVRLDLLRARGVPLPDVDLTDAYARHVVSQALMLSPAPEGETGFDARDSAGVRYRIRGRRTRRGSGLVVVPGLPDRCFDRIVAVVLGAGFGVTAARMASVEPFLRTAAYREESNEWTLPVDHEFWSGPEVEDLTVVLRTAAAQEGRDEAMPIIESIAAPRSYPASRREPELRPPEA